MNSELITLALFGKTPLFFFACNQEEIAPVNDIEFEEANANCEYLVGLSD